MVKVKSRFIEIDLIDVKREGTHTQYGEDRL